MLSVLPDQTVPSAKFSKRKINCKCSCGNPNTISVSWLSFSRRITPTCGKCAVFKWRELNKISYGRLTLNCELDSITAVRQIVLWKCDCGNNKKIKLFAVISGNTTSCGCAYQDMKPKYNTRETKTKEEWLVDFPNLIDENLPESWSRKARLVCSFNCKCGNIFKSPFGIIRKSCGRCNEIAVDENYVINGFTYDGDDKVLKPTSGKKDFFLCKKCNHRDLFIIRYIFRGEYARCKFCNLVHVISDMKFGKLRAKNPRDMYKYETTKEIWICDCGNEHETTVSNVLNSTTKTCGNCRKLVAQWYIDNESYLRKLQCPIENCQLPVGGPVLLETIKNSKIIFKALCPSCKKEYFPRWEGIRLGVSLTCGCTSNRVSSGQNEVFEFIKSRGFSPVLEYSVNKLKYDIYIPEKKLLIEFNGTYWHSSNKSKSRDATKEQNAIQNGFDFISISEDDWKSNKEIVQSIINKKIE